jgi:hypothetical protein
MFRRYLPAMVENLAPDRHDSLPGKLPRDTATNGQLTDGGPSVTPELPSCVAGPPFGAAHVRPFVLVIRPTSAHSASTTR